MAQKSAIQWTDATWNIARGCTKVDADCKYCYMYRDSMDKTRYDPVEVVRTKTVFDLPLKIKEPSKIFTCSLTDFFHEKCDPFRKDAWDIIRKCPQHTFQILTKRPQNIIQSLPTDWGDGWDNVWLGTSIGSNEGMGGLYDLLPVPAKIRFVSFEPLHERINMNISKDVLSLIDWAIIGGESGNDTGKYRYRPCNTEWMLEIANAISDAGGAVFVKQMGTYLAKEMGMSDRHGSNIDEFPELLRVRNFPSTLAQSKT